MRSNEDLSVYVIANSDHNHKDIDKEIQCGLKCICHNTYLSKS